MLLEVADIAAEIVHEAFRGGLEILEFIHFREFHEFVEELLEEDFEDLVLAFEIIIDEGLVHPGRVSRFHQLGLRRNLFPKTPLRP